MYKWPLYKLSGFLLKKWAFVSGVLFGDFSFFIMLIGLFISLECSKWSVHLLLIFSSWSFLFVYRTLLHHLKDKKLCEEQCAPKPPHNIERKNGCTLWLVFSPLIATSQSGTQRTITGTDDLCVSHKDAVLNHNPGMLHWYSLNSPSRTWHRCRAVSA